MDEHFELFLETFGPAVGRQPVPHSTIDRYSGRLPEQLLSYWKLHGWSGYGDGLIWTVDPAEFEPVLDAWVGNTEFMERDAYHIIARGAFGTLYLWGEKSGHSLTLNPAEATCIPRVSRFVGARQDLGVRAFFSGTEKEEVDFFDAADQPLFDRAVRKLGRLSATEMYGFVPALALGGPADLSHLRKVKTIEHLVFLAQLSPLRVLRVPQP